MSLRVSQVGVSNPSVNLRQRLSSTKPALQRVKTSSEGPGIPRKKLFSAGCRSDARPFDLQMESNMEGHGRLLKDVKASFLRGTYAAAEMGLSAVPAPALVLDVPDGCSGTKIRGMKCNGQ
jgi:hypothetical protein